MELDELVQELTESMGELHRRINDQELNNRPAAARNQPQTHQIIFLGNGSGAFQAGAGGLVPHHQPDFRNLHAILGLTSHNNGINSNGNGGRLILGRNSATGSSAGAAVQTQLI